MTRSRNLLGHLYMWAFLFYMFVPLAIMGGAAFNDNRLPSIYPWKGWTDRWFIELFRDQVMWTSFVNTILVALAVVLIAVPLGTAGAILINSISGKVRGLLYGLMVAPILMPGAVIGISTLLFWNQFSVPIGLHLSVLGQVSYIAAFVMLLVLARLQSFDPALEEAALDLGAGYGQVLRRHPPAASYAGARRRCGDRLFPVDRKLQRDAVHTRHIEHANRLRVLQGALRHHADDQRAGADPDRVHGGLCTCL